MISWLRKKFGWYEDPSYDGKTLPKNGKLLFKGRAHGINYYIVDFGSHPCAYVKVGKNHPLYETTYSYVPMEIDIVHGGLTHSGTAIMFNNKWHKGFPRGWFFGWDYAHSGDYYAFPDYFMCSYSRLRNLMEKGKQYTTKEIIDDCEEFCEVVGCYK